MYVYVKAYLLKKDHKQLFKECFFSFSLCCETTVGNVFSGIIGEIKGRPT